MESEPRSKSCFHACRYPETGSRFQATCSSWLESGDPMMRQKITGGLAWIALAKQFARNRHGNFAIAFAVSAAFIVMAVGGALDFSTAVTVRKHLQAAIDGAVLAAASKGTTIDQTYAKQFFATNVSAYSVSATNGLVTKNWTDVDALNFTQDASGNIVGTAHASMKTSLVAIAGISTIGITVTAAAKGTTQTKIASATFKIKSAQGAYDKDIYFYTRDKSGAVTSETLILQYDYTSSGGGKKTFTPATTSSTTINIGDYASYGYKMVVYEDTTYKGLHTNPKTHYSDDADAAKWTKVTGACTDTSGATNNWEDGGDSNYLDFVFTDTCTETTSSTKDVRLVE
jgi:Flp pilus assembly protein TadG